MAFACDSRDPAVKATIARRWRAAGGLPETAEFPVGVGIDSISRNPDAVVATILYITCWRQKNGADGRRAQAPDESAGRGRLMASLQ